MFLFVKLKELSLEATHFFFLFDCTQFLTLLCRLEPNQHYNRYVFQIVIDTQTEEVRKNM